MKCVLLNICWHSIRNTFKSGKHDKSFDAEVCSRHWSWILIHFWYDLKAATAVRALHLGFRGAFDNVSLFGFVSKPFSMLPYLILQQYLDALQVNSGGQIPSLLPKVGSAFVVSCSEWGQSPSFIFLCVIISHWNVLLGYDLKIIIFDMMSCCQIIHTKICSLS